MKSIKKLIANSYLCHSVGILIIFLYIYFIHTPMPQTVANSLMIVIMAYLVCALAVSRITKQILIDRKYYILPLLLAVYCVSIAFILLTRMDYSRPTLLQGFSISLVWLYISAMIKDSEKKLTFKAIPNFDIATLNKHKKIDLSEIIHPYDLAAIKDGLVVDLHHRLSAEQEKFIADCSINNIPVFHSESIRELLEGKVTTSHLSENSLGTLQPPPIYYNFKRIWESALIIATLPISLIIMAMTAFLIKLESPGPVLYTQQRVGQSGKIFNIYKFRSMSIDHTGSESKFATSEHDRVTRIGKIIRKIRIDELPQFLNVLKGEMALIGPRPEQSSFVNLFEQEIPFYGYRHMVKPGITGWAQIVQGYTDDTDSTKDKLSHDLYYIKHLSFWLDMNIAFRTIATILTGFGAK